MEPTEAPTNSLNASQKLHLLTCSQHADKLLGEIEFILAAPAYGGSRSSCDLRSATRW